MHLILLDATPIEEIGEEQNASIAIPNAMSTLN